MLNTAAKSLRYFKIVLRVIRAFATEIYTHSHTAYTIQHTRCTNRYTYFRILCVSCVSCVSRTSYVMRGSRHDSIRHAHWASTRYAVWLLNTLAYTSTQTHNGKIKLSKRFLISGFVWMREMLFPISNFFRPYVLCRNGGKKVILIRSNELKKFCWMAFNSVFMIQFIIIILDDYCFSAMALVRRIFSISARNRPPVRPHALDQISFIINLFQSRKLRMATSTAVMMTSSKTTALTCHKSKSN